MTPEHLAEIRRLIHVDEVVPNWARELLDEVDRLRAELALAAPVVLEDLARIRWVPESHHVRVVSDLQAELHAARQR